MLNTNRTETSLHVWPSSSSSAAPSQEPFTPTTLNTDTQRPSHPSLSNRKCSDIWCFIFLLQPAAALWCICFLSSPFTSQGYDVMMKPCINILISPSMKNCPHHDAFKNRSPPPQEQGRVQLKTTLPFQWYWYQQSFSFDTLFSSPCSMSCFIPLLVFAVFPFYPSAFLSDVSLHFQTFWWHLGTLNLKI